MLNNAKQTCLQRVVDEGLLKEADDVVAQLKKTVYELFKTVAEKSIEESLVASSFSIKLLGRLAHRARAISMKASDKFKATNVRILSEIGALLGKAVELLLAIKCLAFWRVAQIDIFPLVRATLTTGQIQSGAVQRLSETLRGRTLSQAVAPPSGQGFQALLEEPQLALEDVRFNGMTSFITACASVVGEIELQDETTVARPDYFSEAWQKFWTVSNGVLKLFDAETASILVGVDPKNIQHEGSVLAQTMVPHLLRYLEKVYSLHPWFKKIIHGVETKVPPPSLSLEVDDTMRQTIGFAIDALVVLDPEGEKHNYYVPLGILPEVGSFARGQQGMLDASKQSKATQMKGFKKWCDAFVAQMESFVELHEAATRLEVTRLSVVLKAWQEVVIHDFTKLYSNLAATYLKFIEPCFEVVRCRDRLDPRRGGSEEHST